MNNKGFMMAEVIIVAAIILLSLTGFYTLYTKTISAYNARLDYTDIRTLYNLADYRNDAEPGKIVFNNNSVSYEKLYQVYGKTIYLLKYNIFRTNAYEKMVNDTSINKTFGDYIKYLARTQKFDSNANILVMENCSEDKNTGKYTVDCKYAYLETAVK